MANGHEGMDDIAVLGRDGGYWWYWVDTVGDGILPFGAETVASLSGRRYDVRDGDGRILLTGAVPYFPADK